MSTLRVDNLQTSAGTPLYPAKSWVNWNQTGVVSILNDGGISSIADGGVGLATITFSDTKSTINYAFNGSVNTYYTSVRWDVHCTENNYTIARSTSTLPVNMGYGSYAEYDFVRNTAVVTE